MGRAAGSKHLQFRKERSVLGGQSDVTAFNDESLPKRVEVARRYSQMWSTDRMSVRNSALADGPQPEGFVAHGFSGLNDSLTDKHGNAHTN
jgi:hypothetical protein